jgi:hypothetical protein
MKTVLYISGGIFCQIKRGTATGAAETYIENSVFCPV